jgi:hypothetical protein
MSNIGLMVRQRIPIVLMTATFAAIADTARRRALGELAGREEPEEEGGVVPAAPVVLG